ncbi:MAG: hypothetical protein R3F37_18265 [Candidatus Competibacteraceae bacterium]
MAKFSLHNNTTIPVESNETPVDQKALEAFAAGARYRQGVEDETPPWEKHDPEATARYSVSIRLNEYELEMLRYLSKAQGISQHKILNRHLKPLLKKMAIEEFEARGNALSS